MKGGILMATENFSEKISVNINTSTLSVIDILVDNGYYSNRSDFVNQALRESLQKHQSTLDRIIDKNMDKKEDDPSRWFVGICALEPYELETAAEQGQVLSYTGYGVFSIGKDIDEDLLFRTVRSIKVKGKVICSPTIKKHYGLK